ncbi:hypothetical protein FHU41_000467 [Psychromicrobium silvestre]|uniref:Lipoprotein n=1 Tax=Psychromicrobium silvestre TaxID=1645614 RepID=A0A7Y9LRG4_9MICC|nr:hypothetical protein [Psychromicrobium silvestre]NYE94246.1 hypothetical protein [Psychromicrobium silvestre]
MRSLKWQTVRWRLLVLAIASTLVLTGCQNPALLDQKAHKITEKIDQLKGVKSTHVSLTGTYGTGAVIDIFFDEKTSETDFRQSYSSALELTKTKDDIFIKSVNWGTIEFDPSLELDLDFIFTLRKIPGFESATAIGNPKISYKTPLAAVNAVKILTDRYDFAMMGGSRWRIASPRREGQASVELDPQRPELAAMVPEFLALSGVSKIQANWGGGMTVYLLSDTDPQAAKNLATAKIGSTSLAIEVEVLTYVRSS